MALVKTQATTDNFCISCYFEDTSTTHCNIPFHNLQSAFQPDHTTETALIKLTDELLFNMDNNMVTGLAFVNFRKAFNVINH